MAKAIKPHKVVITFDDAGEFKDAVILYRVSNDGVVTNKYNSIGISSANINANALNGILGVITRKVKKIEGVTDAG